MGGYSLGSALNWRSGQMIMVALLLLFGAFYAGTLLGNKAPFYVSQLSSNSSSSSSSSIGNLSLSNFNGPRKFSVFFFFLGLCCRFGQFG
jgi:hypothetical protein